MLPPYTHVMLLNTWSSICYVSWNFKLETILYIYFIQFRPGFAVFVPSWAQSYETMDSVKARVCDITVFLPLHESGTEEEENFRFHCICSADSFDVQISLPSLIPDNYNYKRSLNDPDFHLTIFQWFAHFLDKISGYHEFDSEFKKKLCCKFVYMWNQEWNLINYRTR